MKKWRKLAQDRVKDAERELAWAEGRKVPELEPSEEREREIAEAMARRYGQEWSPPVWPPGTLSD